MQNPASLAKTSTGSIEENLHTSIEPLVLALVINAYKRLRENEVYPLKEHEVRFSAILIPYIEEICSEYEDVTGQVWDVRREDVHDNEQIRKGEKDPNAAPRIDIVVTTWKLRQRPKTRFPFECKRVSENDSELAKLYIQAGIIDRYLNQAKDYAKGQTWGGMIGYIIEGSPIAIIDKLNEQIEKQRASTSEYLVLDKAIENFETIYKSHHQRSAETDILTITHLLFPFSPQDISENK